MEKKDCVLLFYPSAISKQYADSTYGIFVDGHEMGDVRDSEESAWNSAYDHCISTATDWFETIQKLIKSKDELIDLYDKDADRYHKIANEYMDDYYAIKMKLMKCESDIFDNNTEIIRMKIYLLFCGIMTGFLFFTCLFLLFNK